jgi:hypothetical protein
MDAGEPIDVAFYDTRAGGEHLRSMEAAASLIRRTATTSAARLRLHAIIMHPSAKVLQGWRYTSLRSMPAVARCLYAGLSRISHGPGPQFLYKPLLHYLMPADVRRLILLDTDVAVVADIGALHAQFARMAPSAVVGLVPEQTVKLYPPPLCGLNGGVQLLQLERMRSSVTYAKALDQLASGRDGRWIGFLGDQTAYTYMAHIDPSLVHLLPCEFNRQACANARGPRVRDHAHRRATRLRDSRPGELRADRGARALMSRPSAHLFAPCFPAAAILRSLPSATRLSAREQLSLTPGFANQTLHACPARCAVLHANDVRLRCIARQLQQDPSCTHWNALQRGLEDAKAPCIDGTASPGPLSRQMAVALRAYFADCCEADGSPDSNLIDRRKPPWRLRARQ